MQSSQVSSVIMWNAIVQAPYLLAIVAGLIVNCLFLRRHRTSALVAAGGLMLLFLSTLAGLGVQAWFMGPPSNVADMQAYAMMQRGIYFLLALVRAAGLGTILAAVFLGRGGGSVTSPFASKDA